MIQPLVDHPGHLFIREHGPFRNEDDIVSYADFLRTMAGLTDQPPIDLTQIHQRFGIPAPLLAPLQDQQGLLFDSETGIMLIKEDDPITRQRFTNAHELMEMCVKRTKYCRTGHNYQAGLKARSRSASVIVELLPY